MVSRASPNATPRLIRNLKLLVAIPIKRPTSITVTIHYANLFFSDYSYLKDSIGSSFAALIAGSNPATTATINAILKALNIANQGVEN